MADDRCFALHPRVTLKEDTTSAELKKARLAAAKLRHLDDHTRYQLLECAWDVPQFFRVVDWTLPDAEDQKYVGKVVSDEDGEPVWDQSDIALSIGGTLSVMDCDTETIHELGIENIKRGESLMRRLKKHVWDRIVANGGEDEDAACIYLQYCLLGRVVYD